MEVYVVLYHSDDGEEARCYGVFTSKALAEKRIREEIATWGNRNEYTFTRNGDWWLLDGYQCGYFIVTTKLETDDDIKEPEHL
jgi:hypothetical protein